MQRASRGFIPTNRARGYALAIGSHLSGAIGSVASKLLMQWSSVNTASVLWFFVGGVATCGYLLALRGGVNWAAIRRNLRLYMAISLIMTVAAMSWFVSVDLAGPSIVAFVGQLGIVFGIVLGALVLHERLTPMEWVGGLVAVAGALAITYRAGARIELGIVFSLINSLGLALQNLLVKRYRARIDSVELVFVRSWTAFVFILLYGKFTGGLVWPRTWVVLAAFVGSLVGYVAFNLLLYRSLSHIDLARVSILGVISPPVVMLLSLLVFGTVPTVLQLAGSALILVGVSLIVLQPLLKARRATADA